MQLDVTLPEDSVLVSELPSVIRQMKEDLGTAGRKVDVPLLSTSSGQPGDWAVDDSYFYVYTGDGSVHTWARVAVSSW